MKLHEGLADGRYTCIKLGCQKKLLKIGRTGAMRAIRRGAGAPG